jgi:hypothetical protein
VVIFRFACISHLFRAFYMSHLSHLNLISLIIFDGEYKLRSCSLCNIVQPPISYPF